MSDERPWNAPRTEYVYLVSAEGEWPVSAIADDHPSTPSRVEAEVKRRQKDGPHGRSLQRIHVWRARITDLTELELVPARQVEAELRLKQPTAIREESA